MSTGPVPALPGTYVLQVRVRHARRIRIGALGSLDFCPGLYLYVGSALGPGGLRSRIAHHRSVGHRSRWHMDYLRRYATLPGAWVWPGPSRLECRWAGQLRDLPGLRTMGPGFGSSDCHCPSHLLQVAAKGQSCAELIARCLPPETLYIRL